MSYEDIPGWFSDEDVACYRSLVEPIHNGTIVELGTFAGRSAISIGDLCKANNNVLYCVDHWQGSEEYDPSHPYYEAIKPILDAAGWPDLVYDTFLTNIHNDGLDEVIKPLPMQSVEAIQYVSLPVDLVFIDADHRFEAVARDIKSWLPHIKAGGVIAGHDYEPNWPEVVKAVKYCFDEFEHVGNIWFSNSLSKEPNTHGNIITHCLP